MRHTTSMAETVRVVLACTVCEHVCEPDLDTFDGGETGCPCCGGWTFIAELAEPGDHPR